MKKVFSLVAGLVLATAGFAQVIDPIVMRINGQNVTRSEFEYNFNKNNTEGVIDKKSIEEYVDLFINYKLKVYAALDAKFDTLTSYQKEFRTYRDQQIRPLLVSAEAEEKEVRSYYDNMLAQLEGKDLYLPAHIFVRTTQQATPDQQAAAKAKIDSIYIALQTGAPFEELAKKHSEDPGTAQRGGQIGWIGPHQLLKEVEDAMYALKKDEVGAPMQSAVGWHILRVDDIKPLEPYDTLAPRIRNFLESRGIQDKIANSVVDELSSTSGKTVEQIMDEKSDEFAAKDADLKYLIQEYHDGLLLYEICQRNVWEPAAKDTAALETYFKAHKKEYTFDVPHYAGAVLQARDAETLKAVKKALKGKDEDQWAKIVKEQFNKDSVMVRFERRIFSRGQNAIVDSLAFKVKKNKTRINPKYPEIAIVGRKLTKAPQRWTDVSAQVVADYQAVKEREFVDALRQKYPFEVYKEVLNTVNKH